jgi:hypothetical protein
MTRERNWTYKELDILRFNYSTMSDEELGKKLKRTPGAVQTRAAMLGLKKEKAEAWTPQRLKLLTDFYEIMFNDDLAKWIGLSPRTIRRKAKELGLKKGDAFYKRKREILLKRQSEGLKKVECATRFKKGQRPSPATEFKKGHKPSAEVIAKRAETRKRNLAKRATLNN